MAAGNFPACLAITLKEEGGFVDNPADPGGATNLGITIGTLSHYLGRAATVDDVQALTVEAVTPIYHALYWLPVRGDELPFGVDLMVWDTAVNSGPGRAVKLLQEAVGAAVDGIIGSATLALVNATDARALIARYDVAHASFYRSLATFDTFGQGWLNRLRWITQAATAMAAAQGVSA